MVMRKKNGFLLVFILLFFYINISAITQKEKIKNLEGKLKLSTGKQKLEILVKLVEACKKLESTKAINYGLEALKLADFHEDLIHRGFALTHMSYAYWRLQKRGQAFESAKKAIDLFKKINNKSGLADATYQRGLLFRLDSQYGEALRYYLKALEIILEIGDKDRAAYMYYQAGIANFNLKKFTQAMDFYQTALDAARECNNLHTQGLVLNNIGLVYERKGQFEKALSYYQQSFKIFKKKENEDWMNYLYLNIGTTYMKLNRIDLALKYLHEALKAYRKSGDEVAVTRTIYQIGELYYKKKEFKTAVPYFEEAIKKAQKHGRKSILKDLYKEYSNLLFDMGKFKESVLKHRLYTNIKDGIFNEKSNKQITEMQEKYEAEKREKKIEVLKRDKELLLKDFKIQKITTYTFIMAFILITIILLLLFKRYLYFFAFWKKHKTIGQFRLMEKVDTGGMGVVYKAHHIQDNTDTVAIKTLKEELFEDDSSRRRFKHEALITSRLNHPNIVKIIESGEYKGKLFISMEWLEGKTLAKKMNGEGKIDIKECFHIMKQIVDALDLIHSKNIIHRDLKPSNIMLIEKNGDPNFVKLLDFGIAKMKSLTRITTHSFQGTANYMSPEQIESSEVSSASDIFSLGVIFYEMITGCKAFDGEHDSEIIKKILEESPVEPREYCIDISEELNQLIKKMLDKAPDQRPTLENVGGYIKNFHMTSITDARFSNDYIEEEQK